MATQKHECFIGYRSECCHLPAVSKTEVNDSVRLHIPLTFTCEALIYGQDLGVCVTESMIMCVCAACQGFDWQPLLASCREILDPGDFLVCSEVSQLWPSAPWIHIWRHHPQVCLSLLLGLSFAFSTSGISILLGQLHAFSTFSHLTVCCALWCTAVL